MENLKIPQDKLPWYKDADATMHYNAGEGVTPLIRGGYSGGSGVVGTDITLTSLGDALFNIVLIEAD